MAYIGNAVSEKVIMDNFSIQTSRDIEERQIRRLVKSISSLRVTEKADIILTCEGWHFPAHKLVLEASSPYFKTMFESGSVEANDGKVAFENMEWETLEVLLDFIYLGKVENIKTNDQVREALRASDIMQLDDLFSYCCGVFLSTLSVNNFCEACEVATLLTKGKVLDSVLEFMFVNRIEILTTAEFLHLSAQHMEEYHKFSATKQLCMDDMLGGLVKWLHENRGECKTSAKELLQHIKVELITDQYVAALLEDENLMQSSYDIADNLRSYYASLLRSSKRTQFTPAAVDCKSASIGFFNEGHSRITTEKVGEKHDHLDNCWPTYIQHFDVQCMTWLPVQVVGTHVSGAAISQRNYFSYVAGGKLGSVVVFYDVCNRSIEYTDWNLFNETVDAGMCISGCKIYRVDGTAVAVQDIFYADDEYDNTGATFCELNPICYPRSSPVVLSTTEHVFIIGGNDSQEGLIIEYGLIPNYGTEAIVWKTLKIPSIPEMLNSHFFVIEETLQGIDGETLIKLKFNSITHRLETMSFTILPPDHQSVTAAYQFPDSNIFLVFVSTVQKGPPIPNYLFEPEIDKWTKLPEPKGHCSILDCKIKKTVYIMGI